MATLRELRDARIEKLNQLRALGVDPYPAKSYRELDNDDVISNFELYEGKEVIVAGRILSIREHGKLAFIDIKDQTGKIQLYVKADNLQTYNHAESEIGFKELNLLDSGDFLEGRGIVTKTKSGEVSIEAMSLRLLTKSLRPMPEELADKEVRLRRRYLDTNINPDVHTRFLRRARFWEAHREFFKQDGFVEINIPVLEHVTGGADANPFVTHMDSLDQDFYLRISQELYLKRLIGGGYQKVYEIGPRFRNEGLSDEHLPEHIAMEYYWAYANYRDGMEFTKELLRYVCQKVYGTLEFSIRGFEVNLAKEWEIIDFTEIIKERFGIDIFKTTLDEVKNKLRENKQKVDENLNINRGLDQLWKLIRPTIGGPAFMINDPKFLSPLAKSSPETPELTQRFHPIIGGSEVGNGYSELNDPLDQLGRFLEQQNLREAGDAEAQMLDIDFVEMLEYGMPPTLGYGHSERVFWFLENVPAREGVPFPQLRTEVDEVTRGIYPEIFNESKIRVNDKESAAQINRPSFNEENIEQDLDKKIIVIIDKNLESWKILNIVGHISAYIGNKLSDNFTSGRNYYVTKDNHKYSRTSQYPIVVLSATGQQLKNTLQKVKESDILYHTFIKEMLEVPLDKDIDKVISAKPDNDVEVYGIGIFGDKEILRSLTNKYSLYR